MVFINFQIALQETTVLAQINPMSRKIPPEGKEKLKPEEDG